MNNGPESLTDAQLLAIILRIGDKSENKSALDIGRELLTKFGNFRDMDLLSVKEICSIKGIGIAKATQIKAALEIGKRMSSQYGNRREQFKSSEDVVKWHIPLMRNIKKEIFKIVLLDSKNKILKDIIISQGSLTSSLVHPREVLNPAIKESAASIILIHNHPSGDPFPSQDDIEITQRLKQAGDIVGVKVLDHIIIGESSHFSFVDQKMF
jgi:DNA repair protein RadC